MTKQGKLTQLLVAATFGLLVLCSQQPATANAQALRPPLPLPDVTVYGTVTRDGVVLGAGTVKVLLPNGVAVSAPITPVNGTAYNYALKIPLFMTRTTTLSSTAEGAFTGDTVAFFVDNRPAFYQDPATQLTMNELKITAQGAAKTAAGRTFAIDLTMAGAESYPVGDVNANSIRNSADAMLALKYDIGLIAGVTAFPPGPNTAYLPLCDIVENGKCDSGDALRILQCDVGISSVTCPTDRIVARTHAGQTPAGDAQVALRTVTQVGSDPDTVEVQVVLGDESAQFGAASLALTYDPALYIAVGCEENPTGALALASCNPTAGQGVVRFSGVAAMDSVDGVALAKVEFRRLGVPPADLAAEFALRAEGVFDRAGDELAWRSESTPAEPAVAAFTLYLPNVSSLDARTTAQSTPGTQESALPSVLNHQVHLPMIGAATDAAPVEAGAPATEIPETTAPTQTQTLTETQTLNDTQTLTDTSAPKPTPLPTATPVADLPKNDELGEAERGQWLYLPIITEE